MNTDNIIDFTPLAGDELHPLYDGLINNVSEYTGLDPDDILCSCTCGELIFRAVTALKPEKAAVIGKLPECIHALESAGSEIVLLNTPDDAVPESTDLVFLSVFADRFGIGLDPDKIHDIENRCAETGARLIIIEHDSYIPDENICPGAAAAVIGTFPPLMPPVYGKIAYIACKDPGFIDDLRRSGAQNTIDHRILRGVSHIDVPALKRSAEYLLRERQYLAQCFERLSIKVCSSQTDRLVIYAPHIPQEALKARGIILPACEEEGFYKAAILNHEQNARLVYTLTEEICRALSMNFMRKQAVISE